MSLSKGLCRRKHRRFELRSVCGFLSLCSIYLVQSEIFTVHASVIFKQVTYSRGASGNALLKVFVPRTFARIHEYEHNVLFYLLYLILITEWGWSSAEVLLFTLSFSQIL